MKEVPHVILYTDHDLSHNSFWDSLMIREAVRGTITLEFKKRSYSKSVSRLFTTYTEVVTGDMLKRIVIDFHDNFDVIAHENLLACDVYYKVNYRPEFINTLGDPGKKIKPFIPHFTVSGEKDLAIFPRLIGSWMERINYYSLLKPANLHWRKLLQAGPSRLKRYRTFVKFRDNEKYASIKSIQGRIFFIASLYKENSDEKQEVDTRRVKLVQTLKQQFGKHFYGGIVNSERARKQCPELIFQDYLPHTRYLEECKRSDICVYSNGPNNCLSWKLGEYIWLGKPVVSEKLLAKFDPRFNVQSHIIETTNLSQLIEEIGLLQNDLGRREELSAMNGKFYPQLSILDFL